VTLEHYPAKFKPELRRCIKLLKTNDQKLGYCLIFREWIAQCPEKCGYIEEGEEGKIEETKERKLNHECVYFTRTSESKDYYCDLFEQEGPFCDSCQFAAYTD
jgi:hypothetical protein